MSAIKYPDGVAIKSITLKSHNMIDDSVIEFSFFYHIRHTYLSVNEEPSFVYEYKECFSWVDKDNGFLVILNAPDRVTSVIKSAFINAYSGNVINIKLTEKLTKEIFGNEQTKKEHI